MSESPRPDAPEPPGRDDSNDDPDWIDRVSSIAGALGFNKVRVRWKLQRFVNERQRKQRAADNRAERLSWDHKICPECGAINDRTDKVCSQCGARLGSAAMQKLRRLGIIPEGVSTSAALGVAMMIVYARLIMVAGGGIIDMDGKTLILHGANFSELVPSQPWRVLTAVFLHGGLWHLGFNLYALTIVGPYVENVYSRGAALVAFLITGAAGSAAALALGGAFSVGASGAVMGLIGVIVGESQRSGTEASIERRNAMLRWVVIITLFGVFIGNVDHAGHFGGLIAGALLGYFVTPRMVVRAPAALSKAAVAVSSLALAGTVAAAIVPAGNHHETLCIAQGMPADDCPQLVQDCQLIRDQGVDSAVVPANTLDWCSAIDLR